MLRDNNSNINIIIVAHLIHNPNHLPTYLPIQLESAIQLESSHHSTSTSTSLLQSNLLQELRNMPPLLTQVARTMDGLPLVSSQTPSPGMQVTNQHQQEAKEIIRKMTTGDAPTRMSVDTMDNFVFSYMMRDNLCFLVLTESAYPKRLAFLYLEDIADLILSELVREFGNEVRKENEKSQPNKQKEGF